jgi:hypothetical protein
MPANADEFIYRGQANADWGLVPSILRASQTLNDFKSGFESSDNQVFLELISLIRFVDACDRLGLAIPNDSRSFRREHLDSDRADKYFKKPELWPNDEILDLMAMAQHHGVPTRLLDWTRQPYTAVYFAASSALPNYVSWTKESRLCIWALDSSRFPHYPKVRLLKTAGSASPHLAAQSGVFTVHPHNGERGKPFTVTDLCDEFTSLEKTPLQKISIPCYEANRLLNLLNRAGISAATIYPSADGAGKVVLDEMAAAAAVEHHNKKEILVRS